MQLKTQVGCGINLIPNDSQMKIDLLHTEM